MNTAISTPKRYSARHAVAIACALLGSLASPARPLAAKGNAQECAPDGLPTPLAVAGPIEATHSIERDGKPWIVSVDSLARPSKIGVFDPHGDALDLPKLPSSAELQQFVTRGRGIYGVGMARSQVQQSTNIVLARWGSDTRARVTALWPGEGVDAKPRAGALQEYMAVVWGQRGDDGKSHLMAGIVDLEQMRAGPVRDFGARTSDGFIDVVVDGDAFVAVWTTAQGVARAAFDMHGKDKQQLVVQPFADGAAVRGASVCSGRTWLLREASANQIAVWSVEPGGRAAEVTRLPAPPRADAIPMLCVGEGIAIAHRTLVAAKESNVVFWLSTIDGSGRLRQRRVRDIRGGADDVRALQLNRAGGETRAWWLEGAGSAVKLWSRTVACR